MKNKNHVVAIDFVGKSVGFGGGYGGSKMGLVGLAQSNPVARNL